MDEEEVVKKTYLVEEYEYRHTHRRLGDLTHREYSDALCHSFPAFPET